MKAIVTGSAGYIGKHLCEALPAAGWKIVGWDEKPDYIFHLAARTRNAPSIIDPIATLRANVMASAELFKAAAHRGVPVVYASSAVVYSPVITPYQISKIAADSLAQFYNSHGGDIRIVRLADVYGPEMKSGIIAIWREQFREAGEIKVWGGKQSRDYIYVSDAVHSLARAAAYPKGIYEACSGVQTELIDLAKMLKVPIRLVPPLREVAKELIAQQRFGGLSSEVSIDAGMEFIRKAEFT